MSPNAFNESTAVMVDIPDNFICPISLELMRDPLMNRRGQNYDRRSILQWLHRGNEHCPLTRQPLSPSQLVPNNALKTRIRRWSMEHGLNNNEEFSNADNEQEYSYVEERGVIGTLHIEHNNDNTSNTNALSHLVDFFDQVLEITSAD